MQKKNLLVYAFFNKLLHSFSLFLPQMRYLFFIFTSCFFLSLGGNMIYANNSPIGRISPKNLYAKKALNVSNENQDYTIIDDNELDLEEDYNPNESKAHSLVSNSKDNFFKQHYFLDANYFLIKDFSKNFPPFFGYITPDYFNQRVLLI